METIISILTRFVADTVWCCTDSPRVVYTFPNGNVMTLALTREPGRSTWITRRDYAFNNTTLYWHRTDYDAEGRPTETEDSLTAIRQWLYNRRSELVGATGTQTHPYDYMYSYDSIGNRTSSTENGISSTYAANCLNQYTAVNRTIDQSQQLALRSFSEGGSNNFTYDADGNLLQDDRFTYTYDCENRLMSVTPLNPYPFNAVVNAYDHRNRRIRKDVWAYHEGDWRYQETHTFVWDGWNIVLEQIANGDQVIHTIEYFWGNDVSGTEEGAGGVGGLLATRIDGVFYIPVYGTNGNIMMYVDETGTIAAQFDYDPYGRVLVAPNYWENLWNFGFSTKYHDWETDLVAYQLRTYNPTHGRWLNRDPIEEEGGENLYVFVGNSAFSCFDVLGLYRIAECSCPADFKKQIKDAMRSIYLKLKPESAKQAYNVYNNGVRQQFYYEPLPRQFNDKEEFHGLLKTLADASIERNTGYPIILCENDCMVGKDDIADSGCREPQMGREKVMRLHRKSKKNSLQCVLLHELLHLYGGIQVLPYKSKNNPGDGKIKVGGKIDRSSKAWKKEASIVALSSYLLGTECEAYGTKGCKECKR